MSSKATLFLTGDNEHCYEECSEPHYEEGTFKGNTICLEMSKANIEIDLNDEEDLVVSIRPGSELYEYIKKMRD